MDVFSRVTLFVLLIVATQCDEHLHANGPFGHAHQLAKKPNLFNCNPINGIFFRSIRPTSVSIRELKVSSINYFNAETIHVSWIPSSASCKDDIIGVYFAGTPVATGACEYLDFEFVTEGQNTSSWLMINLRRQLEFRYYSRTDQCTGKYAFIAKSPIIQPRNSNEPTQIHLAFGNQNDQIYVSYVTNSSEVTPQCQYGLDPSLLNFQVNGTSVTYKASDMCEGKANTTGPQAFIDPGFMHTMLISDLRPSTTYYYRVGNSEHGWSSVNKFINRPSNADDEINLIAYGDMGVSPNEPGANSTRERVLARVISNNITAVLHIGDVAYANGVGSLWEAFMIQVEPIASRVPYMVGVGNHEYDHITGGDKDPSGAPGPGGFRPSWGSYGADSGGECAVPLVHRFHSPSNGNSLFWYSFDVGPVHIAYYSTEHDFLPSSPQYVWLEKDLSSVDHVRTPWLIVGSHRPMYSSLGGIDQIAEKLKEYIEPLLYKYHVDIHIFGHIHSYERTCPVYQRQCVKDGVTQILMGMGGQSLSYGTYSPVNWSIYHDADFGYAHMRINKTYLEFNYHHNADDQIFDHFILNK